MRNPIEITDKHKLESRLTLESSFIESDPTKTLVVVYRVDLTGSRLKTLSPVVKFSKREHAIPNPEATCIQLATPRYYRKYEESEGNKGIRDEEEAQYVIRTALKTFLDKGKILVPGGAFGQGSAELTFTVDHFWMFCTSAKPKTDGELRKMLKEFGYDCATTIANPSEFAEELGAAFAAYSIWSDVNLSILDQVRLMVLRARRQNPPPEKAVVVYHGPVVYQRNPAKVIDTFPEDEQAAVAPFVKRDQFSHQKEYRFTVSIHGEPKEPTFYLPISTELRHLAKFDT